jgi:hypothetical protein
MKKQILSIGKALSKQEQKAINGGALSTGIRKECPIVLLAAPPEGCRWVQNLLTCQWKLICDDITPFNV